MKNISIFCKLPFLNIHPHIPYDGVQKRGKLCRISSLIRCQQIAEKIGARINPEKDFQDDVCIYVKPGYMFDEHYINNAYIDVIDDKRALSVLVNRPGFIAIASSEADKRVMQSIMPNKIIIIPHHHCNYERYRNPIRKIIRIGIVGTSDQMPYFPETLKEEIKKRGIELVSFTRIYGRDDVVALHKTMDLQVVWRPYYKKLSNSLKIVNAASFGIPTIAFREDGFAEVINAYLPVDNEKEFLVQLDNLINNPTFYQYCSDRCYKIAESYHIDNIIKLYQELQNV